MTLAELLVEIRAQAASLPQVAREGSIERALVTLTGLAIMPGGEGLALRRILTALAQSHTDPAFDLQELDALGPLAVGSLDLLLEALIEGACTQRQLRAALRPALIRRVQ